MKTITRLILGVISSSLLAVGFVRAADQLDPMSKALGLGNQDHLSKSVARCGTTVSNLEGEDR